MSVVHSSLGETGGPGCVPPRYTDELAHSPRPIPVAAFVFDGNLSLWHNYLQLRSLSNGNENPLALEGTQTLSSSQLRETKNMLALGCADLTQSTLPFRFWTPAGDQLAHGAGLEGFVFSERKFRNAFGESSLIHHLDDYFQYLKHVLRRSSIAPESCACLSGLQESNLPAHEKYNQVVEFAAKLVEELQQLVRRNDPVLWSKDARIYTVFTRAFNFEGFRQAHGSLSPTNGPIFQDIELQDLLYIKHDGSVHQRFDTIWFMGIFPLGERGSLGDGGGSPYCIKDHSEVNPEFGTKEDIRQLVERAHSLGMRVIIDLVPNHAALDSTWLERHPDHFLHERPPAHEAHEPRYGFFHHQDPQTGAHLWVRNGGYNDCGTLRFWPDVAQFNYANPEFRKKMIDVVTEWVQSTGIDGFRVDMAHGIFNHNFQRNWGVRTPQTEFFADLITTVREKFPHVTFMAEAYDSWDELSQAGFDTIYLKNDMARQQGCFHHSWYDSLTSRDPARIRGAIERLEFLRWQVGAADGTTFFGNQDEPAPQIVFGPWWKGAAFLTLLAPGNHLFYGSHEIGFDAHDERYDLKPIPFTKDVKIDWQNPDPATKKFFQETFSIAAKLHFDMGLTQLIPLSDPRLHNPRWVGFALADPQNPRGKCALVLANPSGQEAEVFIEDNRLNLQMTKRLDPYGYCVLLSDGRPLD